MRFALIGAAGYIAPRHMEAIHDLGHDLVAAFDPNDSVGVIDRFFPEAAFFTEFERFDRFCEKLRSGGRGVDYVAICSPNYLHDAHIRFGLRLGAYVICEKPIVLNSYNLDALQELERDADRHTYCILQLRLHPSVLKLKESVSHSPGEVYDVDLTYITSRGNWYFSSWKGDEPKSGGVATNIGVHFFDMLQWIFGAPREITVHQRTHDRAAGFIRFARARVKWFLSINYDTLPEEIKASGLRTYRSVRIQDDEFEFSGGFTELHRRSYEGILDGRGFGLEETRSAIEIVETIRRASLAPFEEGRTHELAYQPLSKHPFAR